MRIQTKLFYSFVLLVAIFAIAEIGAVPLLARWFNLSFAQEIALGVIFFIFCAALFLTSIEFYFSLPLREFQKHLFDAQKKKLSKFECAEPDEFKIIHSAIDGIIYDIEEKTEALKKSKELDRLKFEFISTASHQLRTPLTGLKWALALARQKIPKKGETSGLISDALDSVNRMIDLVNAMVHTIQEADAATANLVKRVAIESLIADIVKENRLIAASKSISIRIRKAKKMIPSLDGNPEQLRMIFQNLLSNAIHYNHAGGTVNITINSKNKFVIVKVKDTGIGIPMKERNSLFEQFVRGKEAKKMHTQGSGLGLFLTRSMVVRHGGELSFTSVYKKGATSIVKLPIKHSGELESFIQY